MEQKIYDEYVEILKEELLPAMGCTEPIAVAYAAAVAVQALGEKPESVEVNVSANIIKNVKSVVVPCTGGLRGIGAAVCAGIVAGCPEKELEILEEITGEQKVEMKKMLDTMPMTIRESDKEYIFDIQIKACAGGHSGYVEIAGFHTNVICVKKDDEIIREKAYEEQGSSCATDRSLLTVEKIIEFADCVDVADVEEVLQRQIDYNWAIAEEGMTGNWGAAIGKTLMEAYGNSVHNRAKAMAAAGSDARMNGCELPVIINSGSGNQGMTSSIPVIEYAKEFDADEDTLYRALALSNLVTIHQKTGIGRLSAYCGAVSAGAGAGAGIAYLCGGGYEEVIHTVVNALAIVSGIVCDGAKASCAAKIASAVDAGILGYNMYKRGQQFYGGDGIVTRGVEETIQNVGRLGKQGMKETNEEIIKIMVGE